MPAFRSTQIATSVHLAGAVSWDIPDYWGYSDITGTNSITGSIYASKTSGVAPLGIHVSARDIVANGVDSLGNNVKTYMHLEFKWEAIHFIGGNILSDEEITNPNSLTMTNMYTSQIGGEAAFIFHEPGTYTIRLTAKAANGYTQQFTLNITVTLPDSAANGGYDRKYFDPDNGNDANDGLQHWDASALTNGTYTEETGELTQVGSGFAINYDHAAATAETYSTYKYNEIWLDWGASSGWKRIASNPDNDTLILLDKLGSDQTGVTSSNGPKETFTEATDVDTDTAHYMKNGSIYDLDTSISASDGNGIRFIGWGSSGRWTLRANFNGSNMINLGGAAGNLLHFFNATIDANGSGGNSIECMGGGLTSTPSGTPSWIFADCEIKNSNQNRLSSFNYGTTTDGTSLLLYNTIMDFRGGSPVETKESPLFWRAGDNSHTAVVGCRFYSDPIGSATFDHYCYFTGSHDHRLRSYNDFPSILNANEMGFCFNENSSNVPGDVQRYVCYWANRFRNARAGIDPANTESSPPGSFGNGTFEDLVVIGNSFEGDGTSTEFYLGVYPNSGLETAFIGHNMGINLFRGIYEPNDSRGQNYIYLDGNVCYNTRVINCANKNGNYAVLNTVSHHTSATAVSLAHDTTDNGGDTQIKDNNLYAPNDATPILNGSTQETVTDLNNPANNSGNISVNPGFLDPAIDDYRTAA